jgi:hypothetical protein
MDESEITKMSSIIMLPFHEYHQEFQSLTRQIAHEQAIIITTTTTTTTTHEKEECIHLLWKQCHDLLKQMSIEARDEENKDNTKEHLLATVRMCKSQLAALEQEYKHQQTTTTTTTNNNVLVSGKDHVYHNEKMAQQQQQQQQQEYILDRARQTLRDTEIVASEITTELAHNRETLEQSRAHVSTFSTMTEKAASIIKTMSRRRGIKD